MNIEVGGARILMLCVGGMYDLSLCLKFVGTLSSNSEALQFGLCFSALFSWRSSVVVIFLSLVNIVCCASFCIP